MGERVEGLMNLRCEYRCGMWDVEYGRWDVECGMGLDVKERKGMVVGGTRKTMNQSSKDRTWSAVPDALIEVIK